MGSAVRAPGAGRKSNNLAGVGDPSLTRVNPPDDLRDEIAVSIWKSQSKIMIERGTLSREDLPILMAYCNAFSRLVAAESESIKVGFYSRTADGSEKKHPIFNIIKDAESSLARLGGLLGLDPTARTRFIGAGKNQGDGGGNEFDEFD